MTICYVYLATDMSLFLKFFFYTSLCFLFFLWSQPCFWWAVSYKLYWAHPPFKTATSSSQEYSGFWFKKLIHPELGANLAGPNLDPFLGIWVSSTNNDCILGSTRQLFSFTIATGDATGRSESDYIKRCYSFCVLTFLRLLSMGNMVVVVSSPLFFQNPPNSTSISTSFLTEH